VKRLHDRRNLARGATLAALALQLVATVSCSPPSDARISVVTPDAKLFPPAADLMAYRCGSLDCHGSAQRNFVIWSCYGLRLDAGTAPGCRTMGGTNTTADEYTATFDSLVGLEPALMSQVVQSGGADLDQLTFVRKARGEEEHKGGKIWNAGGTFTGDGGTVYPGDDFCVADWLADRGATTGDCQSTLAHDIALGTQ
jgi:hypothetical protein